MAPRPRQTLCISSCRRRCPISSAGLRIAGGLSLIGAVVAEIAAGTAGAGSGLAYRIAESGYRLNIPRMFAALLLLRWPGLSSWAALALLPPAAAALARERAWKGKLMTTGSISSEKIDLLIYGPVRPILDNGFSDHFVVHKAETRGDLERLTPAIPRKDPRRGGDLSHRACRQAVAVAIAQDRDGGELRRRLLPRRRQITPLEHNIIVTNTPDVLTEEVADVAMGLLISTVREFIKADRYVRSGLWQTQNYPLSVGSLRDRKVGIVGMGRIGQAIARRLERSGCRWSTTPAIRRRTSPTSTIPI